MPSTSAHSARHRRSPFAAFALGEYSPEIFMGARRVTSDRKTAELLADWCSIADSHRSCLFHGWWLGARMVLLHLRASAILRFLLDTAQFLVFVLSVRDGLRNFYAFARRFERKPRRHREIVHA